MKKKNIVAVCIIIFNFVLTMTVFAGPVLDQILARGELRIGTTGMQPPMTAIAEDGSIIGVDADLARGLAKAMGLDVVFVTMPFNELLPALEKRKVDLVLSGMTMTTQRNQKVAFVGPYYVSGKGILAKAERYAALKGTTGLDTPKVTIAAVKDSTSLDFTKSLMPKAKLMTPQSLNEAIDLLFNGTVDVIVADFPFCVWSVFSHKEKRLFAGESPLTYEPLGIALPEDTLLINLVQNYLGQIKDNGQMKKIGKKWFNELSWMNKSQ